MIWRTFAIALAFHAAAAAGEPKWSYVKLIDAPIAPSERPTPVKIIKVSAQQLPVVGVDPPMSVGENAVYVLPEAVEDRAAKASSANWRVFVGGEVHRVGSFTAHRAFTALQAVIAAGGAKELGATHEIVVLRYGEKNAPPKASRIDLSQSLAGKGATDLWLETHDVVIVPKGGQSTEEVIQSVPPAIAAAAKERTIPAPQLKPVSKQVKK
jgi:hypothetical protein